MTMVADVSTMSMSSAGVHVGNSGTIQRSELMIRWPDDPIVVYAPV